MKKIISLLLAVLLCPDAVSDAPPAPSNTDWTEYTTIPYAEVTEEGSVDAYTTAEGITYLIYTPYGYDPAQQYNVLVYLNGKDGDPYKMLGTAASQRHYNGYFNTSWTTKKYLDFLIQEGYSAPLIVVACNTPTSTATAVRYEELLQYTVEHYSTYASGPDEASLIAARKHFAIAGPSTASMSICMAIQALPDIFGSYGLFSALWDVKGTLQALGEKQPINYLVMGAGETDYKRYEMEYNYPAFAALENVEFSCFVLAPRAEHQWMAFDVMIYELLRHFSFTAA